MTRLYFVRHGEALGNIVRRFHGHFDSPLTENGEAQVKLLAERFKDIDVDVIYSSELDRAFNTALAIANVKNLPITKISELKEINGGLWEDVPWAELPVNFPEAYELWLNNPHLLEMPEGESMEEFQKRLIHAVENIVRKNENKNICIVSHGTAIKALMCHFKGIGLENLPALNWYDNASITVIDIENGKYNVVAEGDNTHLGELSTLAKQSWWKKMRRDSMLTKERILEILKEAGVLLEGHFLLTSGRHSAKYLQCAKIFQNSKYAEELCADLAKKFSDDNVELVIGPAIGAIQMAYEVSRHLGVNNIFAERENGIMTLRRGFTIEKGQNVLVVEDVVTTGGSVKEVIEIVKNYGGNVIGVGSIVDRTGGKIDFGVKYSAVISMEVESFESDNCPYCKENIPVVKPGSRAIK